MYCREDVALKTVGPHGAGKVICTYYALHKLYLLISADLHSLFLADSVNPAKLVDPSDTNLIHMKFEDEITWEGLVVPQSLANS